MRRHIIRGLKPEYIPYVTSIQGLAQQPSLEEFESLLSSQESLAMQMVGLSVFEKGGDTDNKNVLLIERKKNFNPKGKKSDSESSNNASHSFNFKKGKLKCYRCDKGDSSQRNEEDWGKCFMAKVTSNPASIDFENNWIVDYGCRHHVTGDASKFSSLHPYQGKDVIVTADNTVHYVEKEGIVVINGSKDNSITLNNVYHVPGMTKNLFLVSNAVDAGNYILFGPKDVKFLQNIDDLKADVVHIGKRVNDVNVLSTSTSFVEKLSGHHTASIWHARLGHLNMAKFKVMGK
ncbi:hypothetical protein L6164_023781 [Bauhinia variegata]|uniref:Uncharacterized protein n=1 Tax=Bauhinia variegata TaxID=167791 RepID=A0ACB9ML09_BAUVA|nr:hypothetical protein L6164_023781 [Bauhinia variegata]